MPASGAVDGGLCAVGAGGEVERGVGRYSSAIYGKENDMSKQRYGRPSTGQKGNNRPTVVISRESYDEVDSLSIGTGMSRSAIIDYFISEGLKRARIEEVVIKTKRLVLED
ncbi:hypothetical protein [Streptococcus suis]|nr:hypothetical protein [Streptococcus suis]